MEQAHKVLEGLGYKQELERSVNALGHMALILSDITPTASLLVVGTAVVAVAGPGSVWAHLIGRLHAVARRIVVAGAVAGVTHWHQPASILPQMAGAGARGGLAPVATGAVIAAIATALFSVNGYDAGINFAEEVLGSAAQVGKAVVA